MQHITGNIFGGRGPDVANPPANTAAPAFTPGEAPPQPSMGPPPVMGIPALPAFAPPVYQRPALDPLCENVSKKVPQSNHHRCSEFLQLARDLQALYPVKEAELRAVASDQALLRRELTSQRDHALQMLFPTADPVWVRRCGDAVGYDSWPLVAAIVAAGQDVAQAEAALEAARQASSAGAMQVYAGHGAAQKVLQRAAQDLQAHRAKVDAAGAHHRALLAERAQMERGAEDARATLTQTQQQLSHFDAAGLNRLEAIGWHGADYAHTPSFSARLTGPTARRPRRSKRPLVAPPTTRCVRGISSSPRRCARRKPLCRASPNGALR